MGSLTQRLFQILNCTSAADRIYTNLYPVYAAQYIILIEIESVLHQVFADIEVYRTDSYNDH